MFLKYNKTDTKYSAHLSAVLYVTCETALDRSTKNTTMAGSGSEPWTTVTHGRNIWIGVVGQFFYCSSCMRGGLGVLTYLHVHSMRGDPLIPIVANFRGISQHQPEPSQPTKKPFIHLRSETNHYIQTAYIYLVHIYHIM